MSCGFQASSTPSGQEGGAISCLQYSPDGKWLASASADATVAIREHPSGRVVDTLSGKHEQGVNDVAWSSDSRRLCTASDDGTIVIWDSKPSEGGGGVALRTLKGHKGHVFCVRFSPSGHLIASGSFDNTVKLWSVRTGKCIRTLPAHLKPVTSVDFDKSGEYLLSSSFDGLARIWDVETGKLLRTIANKAQTARKIANARFTPNGKFVLTSLLGGALELWEYKAATVRRMRLSGHKCQSYCTGLGFYTVQGLQLGVCGSEDGNVYLWNMKTGEIGGKLQHADNDVVLSIACHPSEPYIASGPLGTGGIKVWKRSVTST